MPDGTVTTTPAAEGRLPGEPPLVGRLDWAERHPWLVHGVTTRTAPDGAELNFRLRGPAPAGRVLEAWDRLREGSAMTSVVHARQVHGAAVRVWRGGPPGLLLAPPCDGHLTAEPGVLLAVGLADCVPLFLVEPESRTLGLLHAGWRGTAAGILERGVEAMWDRFAVEPDRLHLHLGAAISGARYEVGPEVFAQLGLAEPPGPAPLDLRAHLAQRAVAAGVPEEQVGVSGICVRDDPRFYSHRGGDTGRQLAVLGYRGRPGRRP